MASAFGEMILGMGEDVNENGLCGIELRSVNEVSASEG